MEKKTMGKFIAVLRKANGMTQQELADKLLVSDKTVRKWECDERMPDISLLPAIAEVFGITTDELLRGERNNPERENYGTEENETKQKVKSDKQFNLMLDKKVHTYKGLSFISISLLIVAMIIAVTVNFAGHRGEIAFLCATILCIGAEVCQILFAHNAWIKFDEEDGISKDKIVSANNKIARDATAISFACLGSIAFYSPMAAVFTANSAGYENVSIKAESFFLMGGLLMCCTLFAAFAVYVLFVRKALHNKEIIIMAEDEEKAFKLNKSMMSKMAIAFLCVVVVFGVSVTVVNKAQLTTKYWLDSWEEVVRCIEDDYDEWLDEKCGQDDVALRQYYDKIYKVQTEFVVFEENSLIVDYFIDAYYHKDHYVRDGFTYISERNLYQVEEIINDDVEESASPIIYSLLGTDLVLSFILYLVFADKNKKKVLAGAVDVDKAEEPMPEELAVE